MLKLFVVVNSRFQGTPCTVGDSCEGLPSLRLAFRVHATFDCCSCVRLCRVVAVVYDPLAFALTSLLFLLAVRRIRYTLSFRVCILLR